MTVNINRRESAALINSLTAGVVPRIGLRHIAVGRQGEVNAFLQDLATIEDGGAAFRFVCGQYGTHISNSVNKLFVSSSICSGSFSALFTENPCSFINASNVVLGF